MPLATALKTAAALAVATLIIGPAAAEDGSRAPLQPASHGLESPGFVDLVAAEFYESRLRLAQSRMIEAETAQRYLSLPPMERNQYREERRRVWRSMKETERAALRQASRPRFSNLDEGQKEIFRRIAEEELGAKRPEPTGEDI